MPIFESTTAFKIIYVLAIPDELHDGLLKVGETTLRTHKREEDLPSDCEDLKNAANKRIKGFTQTAGLQTRLLYTELAVRTNPRTGRRVSFGDRTVHSVLENSGVARVRPGGVGGREWFRTNLETVRSAIAAAKANEASIPGGPVNPARKTIVFRDEQEEAIRKTRRAFKTGTRMLWNAKMRFGKTLTALRVVQLERYRRVAIVTHRPVVGGGWLEEFNSLFSPEDGYRFLFKSRAASAPPTETAMDAADDPVIDRANDEMLRAADAAGDHFIYFASTHDLVGSEIVGGTFPKNKAVFDMDWDLIIEDEAHEGFETERGKRAVGKLAKKNTRLLSLSGTPFNILSQFTDETVFTWDYVQEQRTKNAWESLHPGESNPYADLPRMHIFTYDLARTLPGFSVEDLDGKYFNFQEFFRTWTGDGTADGGPVPDEAAKGGFVHASSVRKFLDCLTKDDDYDNYPFATEEFRDLFRHSFWRLPGVREAAALERMLSAHPIFRHFKIVNVAGENSATDEEEERANLDALEKVRSAIAGNDYTITLSCGRLTTGVTVPEWTAVLMLAGGSGTSASSYLQTIFRVQSPGSIDGRQKTDCYVFDFAPTRTLKILAEAAGLTEPVRRGTSREEQSRRAIDSFLEFCPVQTLRGSLMEPYNVDALMTHLKNVFADRAVRTGFDDDSIYSDALLRISDKDARNFKELLALIGRTAPGGTPREVPVGTGPSISEADIDRGRTASHKPEDQRSARDREAIRKYREAKENRRKAISILRGLSIRFPLMFYGLDVPFDEDVDLARFVDLIDSQSWAEFMPAGLGKRRFKSLLPFYDKDVVIAAGRRIRVRARNADGLRPTERVKELARIFATFKNPDKETVLTPWKVVNRHLSDTIGGYAFFDETFSEELDEPRWVARGDVSDFVFGRRESRILELNSKSGLYPLYIAYALFRNRLGDVSETELTVDATWRRWEDAVRDGVFVVCKTPMAEHITRRTLLGYRESAGIVHARTFPDLIASLKKSESKIIKKITTPSFWEAEGELNMKIDAIVGNPPYQEKQASEKCTVSAAMAGAIYPLFVSLAEELNPRYVSMVTPSRWMTRTGRGISGEWVDKQLQGNHYISLHDFPDATELFPNVSIKGGVCYFLISNDYTGKCEYILHDGSEIIKRTDYLDPVGNGIVIREPRALSILSKVRSKDESAGSFSELVGPNTLFCDCAKGLLNSNWDGYVLDQDSDHTIKYFLNKKMVRSGFAWIRPQDMVKGAETLPLHKVFIPEAGGSGNDRMVLGVPFYGEPGSICSQTYICIGFDPVRHNFSEEQCLNIISYIKTRFFRFLVSLSKKTQHSFAHVYRFVPVQDWSKPWTDDELFRMYGLEHDEIEFIKAMIRPME